MNCAEVMNHMENFLNGSLGGAQARSIRNHLASCPHCASALPASDRIEALASMDEEIEPSQDFQARFLAKLERHRAALEAGPQRSWRRLFLSWNPGLQLLAAGTLAVAVLIGLHFGRYRAPDPVTPPAFMKDVMIAENLPLLQDMSVIENLDLLEDFDAIQNLNAAGPARSTVQ